MPTQPFPIDSFGGLNLVDDPQELGAAQAVALSNVDFSTPGRIRTRDGWALLSTSATTNSIQGGSYYRAADGTEFLVVTDGSTVYPFDLSTGTVGTTASLTVTGGNNSFVRFGTPTETLLIVAASATLQSFDGSAWTNLGVAPDGTETYLAITPSDNRLVVASSGVTSGLPGTGGEETLYFSDPGDPTTFGANNFVGLWPGDGEPITALARWRDRLFAFKQSKFAVFTGTQTDTDGNPVFPYYGVDAGQGANSGAVVVADEGLFFANNSGVYATTGQAPVYLSRPLEPWIRAGSYAGLPSLSMANVTLAYFARTLYVTDRTNRTTLVYDTVRQTWSVWSLGATAGFAVPSSSALGGFYFGDFTTEKVCRVSSASTTDNGAAVTWSHKSGLYSPGGDPSRVTVTLESKLVGTGTATLKVATFDAASSSNGALDTGSAVTLGTSPAVAEGWQQIDREGAWFQHEISGSGPASVSRLVHYVMSMKPPGVA